MDVQKDDEMHVQSEIFVQSDDHLEAEGDMRL